MKSILIADDHPMFRQGMRSVVDTSPDYRVVGEVGDGEACIAQAELLRPDFLVVDLNMPKKSGFEVAEWASQNLPQSRTVIISMYAEAEYVRRAMEAGACAFVAKEDAGVELLKALETCERSFFMSSSVGHGQVSAFAKPSAQSVLKLLPGLTASEMKVLSLVARSKTSRQISQALGISERTVHSHRRNICAKLELRGAHSLLQFAMANRELIERKDRND